MPKHFLPSSPDVAPENILPDDHKRRRTITDRYHSYRQESPTPQNNDTKSPSDLLYNAHCARNRGDIVNATAYLVQAKRNYA